MKSPTCPAELWPEFSRLLDQALELPESERAEWLQRLGPAQAAVQPWLRRVLLHPDGQPTQNYLNAPRVPAADAGFVAGQRIGPWALQQEIGRGGMGVVWRVLRADGQLTREAALKLPHAHLLAGSVRERFARERDILAALNHPHIATLYDAGLAADGQPFLALEYVQGDSITTWCEIRAASLEQRLELMRQVMAAVQYAHSRLVVHRDLKPSNVIVNADGQVRLLDFGIAKLLSAEDAGAANALTQVGRRIATPDYAAPEQLAGAAITTATDVYALGVMLYELLTGQRPFSGAGQARLPLQRDAQADAPLASTRISEAQAGRIGGLTVKALRAALRGDIDAILAKALSAQPEDRYASVEALAADLERSQRHLPIVARRIGRLQLAAKFLHRHRLGASLASSLLLAITIGVVAVFWQSQRTAEQARRADATRDFLVSLFIASDPRIASDKPRGEITARELLDLGAQRVEREFADDPLTQVELYGVITDMYLLYGDDARSEAMQRRREEMGRALFGETHPTYLTWLQFDLSRLINRSQFDAAEIALARMDQLLTRGGHDDSALRAGWWISKEAVLTYRGGSAAERRHALDEAIRLLAKYAPTHTDYGTAVANRATNAYHEEDYPTAKADTLRAIDIHRSSKDINDLQLAAYWGNLGNACLQLGEVAEADRAYARATELLRRTGALDDGWYWRWEASHARALHLQGERSRADAMFEALTPRIPTDWREYPDDAYAHRLYGERLLAEGRPDAALRWLEQADREYAKPGSYPPEQPGVQLLLGLAYAQLGRADAARSALAAAQRFFGDAALAARRDTLAYTEQHGRALLALGDDPAARAAFDQVIDSAAGRETEAVALAWAGRARLHLNAGANAEALAASARALEVWPRISGLRDARSEPYLQRVRADVLAAAGRTSEAQALEDAAWQASQRYDAPESATTRRRVMKRRMLSSM